MPVSDRQLLGVPDNSRMLQTPSWDRWIWAGLIATILVARSGPGLLPALGHDSFQYISAAQNMLRGLFDYTSLVHYDVERSFGILPAPMLTFPPGYPILIALLGLTGLSMQTAAGIVCIASTVGSLFILAAMANRLGLSRTGTNAVMALFVFNGTVVQFGGTALSEAPFSFCALLGARLLWRAGDRKTPSPLVWLAAGAAFGVAYLVRYAGLFFIAGLAVLAVRHLVARDWARARGHALAFAAALVPVGLLIARNFALVGNWMGRDEMRVHNQFLSTLTETLQAINALILGSGTSASLPGGTFVPKLLLVICVTAAVTMLAVSRLRSPRVLAAQHSAEQRPLCVDLLLLAGTYAAGMLYAGMTSSISYGAARNFLPIAGFIAIVACSELQAALNSTARSVVARRSVSIALMAALCLYAYLNLPVLLRARIDSSDPVREQMSAHLDDGRNVSAAILDIVGAKGVVLSNDGQAVGHVLGLRTISTVPPQFSKTVWNEETVRQIVDRFHVGALVISSSPSDQPDVDDFPDPFIRQLAQGDAPSWLKPAFRSGRIVVFTPRQ